MPPPVGASSSLRLLLLLLGDARSIPSLVASFGPMERAESEFLAAAEVAASGGRPNGDGTRGRCCGALAMGMTWTLTPASTTRISRWVASSRSQTNGKSFLGELTSHAPEIVNKFRRLDLAPERLPYVPGALESLLFTHTASGVQRASPISQAFPRNQFPDLFLNLLNFGARVVLYQLDRCVRTSKLKIAYLARFGVFSKAPTVPLSEFYVCKKAERRCSVKVKKLK